MCSYRPAKILECDCTKFFHVNIDEYHSKKTEEILDSVRNAKRVFRDQGSDAILRQPELLPFLIEYLSSDKKDRAIKAAWVLELVCLYEIRLLLPYLERFTPKLSALKHESAIRPVSKICSLVCQLYTKEPEDFIGLEPKWKEDVIEASFDWLTGDHKIASQVFAMETLFLLGKESDWIHEELYSILDRDYPNRSTGYQCRARKIMDKISKVKRKKP